MIAQSIVTSLGLIGVLALGPWGMRNVENKRGSTLPFLSPSDVTVDEKGETATVLPLGRSRLATVDLRSGKIEEKPQPGEKLQSRLSDVSWHLEHLALNQRYDRAMFERRGIGKGYSNLRGVCVTPNPDWPYLFVHQRPKSEVPASQVPQGWVFTNALSTLLDGVDNGYVLTALLDEPSRAYADPSDVAVSPDGERVFVVCAGADTVLVVDIPRLRKYLETRLRLLRSQIRAGATASEGYKWPDDLIGSRQYVMAKLPTQANPRRLGLSGDGKTLVVSNYLAGSLTVIDAVNLKILRHIPLGGPKPDAHRRSEILFNSAKLTFHGQFTCASCHPNGDADGLVWDLERDGIGNFKKTKSLLGVKDAAPYGWHGSSPTLADRITGTLRTLHRHEPRPSEAEDLTAYLESLPAPRPKSMDDVNRAAFARGKALFIGTAGCARCHQGESLQDGKTLDVGTRGSTDTQDPFKTPSLRGVGEHFPYLHDGRAQTLHEVFEKHNPRQRHGAAHLLNRDELEDLIVYLKHL